MRYSIDNQAKVINMIDVHYKHCEKVERNPSESVKSRLGSLIIHESGAEARRVLEQVFNRPGIDKERVRMSFTAGSPDHVAEETQKLLDAGLDGLIFNMPHMEDPAAIELAGRTLAGLRQPAATL